MNSPILKFLKNLTSGQFSLFGSGGNFVGLSLGTSSAKCVELKKSGKSYELTHFGVIGLGDDAILDREISNAVSITESLKTLSQKMSLKSKDVCSSISGTSVIIKRMSLDVPNLKELQEQVFWEAEQYIPYDPSDVVMDYALLSPTRDTKRDVLLVAVKKSVLDSYMGVIENAKLRPAIIDLDFFALIHTFEANYSSERQNCNLIVDIGAQSMKSVVAHDGIPVFTKDATLGGKQLTSEIQKHLNLSFLDAESLKVSTAGSPVPEEVNELRNAMAENISSEVKRVVDFFNASGSGAQIQSVYLTGGSSQLVGLVEKIQSITQLSTHLLNPFNQISVNPKVFSAEYLRSVQAIAAIPVGLAIRAGAQ